MPVSLLPSVNVTSRDCSGQSRDGNGRLTVIHITLVLIAALNTLSSMSRLKAVGSISHCSAVWHSEASCPSPNVKTFSYLTLIMFISPLSTSRV